MLGRCSITLLGMLALAAGALAQCTDFASIFGPSGVNGAVDTSIVFDDGTGAALYVGGYLTNAAGVAVNRVTRWNGTNWQALGAGFTDGVAALCAFDDGHGPALYAGGTFDGSGSAVTYNVARWDGAEWVAVGPGLNDTVNALCVYDDGSGAALYAGGSFTHVVGSLIDLNGLARWDGANWSPVPGGGVNPTRALAVHDDGTGPALYVGGGFTHAGTIAANGIARYSAAGWSALASGVQFTSRTASDGVWTLASLTLGGASDLWIGGQFGLPGAATATNIARWNGATLADVAGGTDALVRTLIAHDDGGGPRVFAGGVFLNAGGVPVSRIAAFDGANWSAVGAGMNGEVHTLVELTFGAPQRLVAGGTFDTAGAIVAGNIAAWDGSIWSKLSGGEGLNGTVVALQSFDDGSGPGLYAAGTFSTAGDTTAFYFARWNGVSWSAVGSWPQGSMYGIASMLVFDDGAGPKLYATGSFSSLAGVTAHRIARWDGNSWQQVGNGLGSGFGQGDTLFAYDDGSGPKLYAGGSFTQAEGAAGNCVARWDGTSWSAVGGGMTSNNGYVGAFAAFDDGSGTQLYAAGDFTIAEGQTVTNIVRWDGAHWTSVGGGIGTFRYDSVSSLAVFDDGSGPALYAGGLFSLPSHDVARWKGVAWLPVGSGLGSGGLSGGVMALRAFDDGEHGPALYATGAFNTLHRFARWNGTIWSAVGAGFDDWAWTLCTFDDGSSGGPSLFIGGQFHSAGGQAAGAIARLSPNAHAGCVAHTGLAFCAGDGSASACPCGNYGSSGHGCANASSASGAVLEALGQANISFDDVTLRASGMPATTTLLFFQGTTKTNGGTGAPFGDGLRCVGGNLIRLVIRSAQNGAASFGHGVGNDPPLTIAGAIPSSGAMRQYQAWYRDAQSFCTSSTFNLTNGLSVSWQP